MDKKKAFIGYDLGDGETITDMIVTAEGQAKQNVEIHFDAMKMPDSNIPGRAIPTVYGYRENELVFASTILNDPEMVTDVRVNFKRCPSDLMPDLSHQRQIQIMEHLEKGWPAQAQCPELYSAKMQEFANAAITFTNAVFSHSQYQQKIGDAAFDCQDITFCVGHPTKWNNFDVAVYKGILSRSILGKGVYLNKPTNLVMAAESRAAFLHVKNKGRIDALPRDNVAVLIDIGSSTVDITAMTADSRHHVYNSGNNYLGARCVDFAIQEWYDSQLRVDEMHWSIQKKLREMNPAMNKSLTLACRTAKEECFSVSSGSARIDSDFGIKARINAEQINEMISTVPVAQLLKDRTNLPAEVSKVMGSKSYAELFREYIRKEKAAMDALELKIGRIILTGSASQMPFVMDTIHEVFGEVATHSDMDPSRSISMGLALVGTSDVIARRFEADVEQMMNTEIPKIIADDLPKLADTISPIIEKRVISIVKKRFGEWRSSNISTLARMSKLIEEDCTEAKLSAMLRNDKDYLDAVEKWAVDVVGRDIAQKLKAICQNYGVNNVTLDDLNVLKAPTIQVGKITINPADDVLNMIGNVIGVIAGIIIYSIVPSILVIIVLLISYISSTLAILLLELLVAMGPVGLGILAGIAGAAIYVIARRGLGAVKEFVGEKMQTANLPQVARNLISDSKLDKKIAEANLTTKIKSAILEKKSKDRIVDSITRSLREQVKTRADEIKYIL